MIKEYIEKLQSENEEKINDLEQEMQELVNDLSCAERVIEEMRQEKCLDTNIFSPRAMNSRIDETISEKQEKIRELKQRMEYVAQMIEECMNIRLEYMKLHEELEQDGTGKTDIEDPITKENIIGNDTANENSNDNSNENSNDEPNVESREILNVDDNKISDLELNTDPHDNLNESSNLDLNEIVSFLDIIYHKTETSLALLNGNKNRCRTELRSCMKLIKDFAKKLENNSD